MKQIIVVTVLTVLLAACGRSPKADGEKRCELRKAFDAAVKAGNRDEAARIEIEGQKFEDELKNKYKDDSEGAKALNEASSACQYGEE